MKTKFSIVTMFLIILTMITGCKSGNSEYDKMVEFAQKYTDAWNSKQPEKWRHFMPRTEY